jgi:hypothetical protein
MVKENFANFEAFLSFLPVMKGVVAPQFTVVMRTTAQPGLARLVQGAHAAEVVSSEEAATRRPRVRGLRKAWRPKRLIQKSRRSRRQESS